MNDYPKKIRPTLSLRARDAQTGELKDFPTEASIGGHSRTIEIKEAETALIGLMEHLADYAYDTWRTVPSDKVEDLLERYCYTDSTLRYDYFNFDCAIRKLRELIGGDLTRIQMLHTSKIEKSPTNNFRSTTKCKSLIKTLTNVYEIKQLLIGLLGYFTDKEDDILQYMYDYEEEDEYREYDFTNQIFVKINSICDFIEKKEETDSLSRQCYREFYGLEGDKFNEQASQFSTEGMYQYFEERGMEGDIKFFEGYPYILGPMGKRIFVRFVNKEAELFAYSYSHTFDIFKTGSLKDAMREAGICA